MKFISALLALGLCVGFAGGCQAKPTSNKLNVGKVDTAALLQDNPDYQNMSVDYLKEQAEIRQSFAERLEATGRDEAAVLALQEEFLATQEEFNIRWEEKTEEFLKSRHDSIHATAASIAQRKNIQLVVIDSRMYPTVEWGGVDMTKDMALAMSDGEKSKPAETPTPDGDEG